MKQKDTNESDKWLKRWRLQNSLPHHITAISGDDDEDYDDDNDDDHGNKTK